MCMYYWFMTFWVCRNKLTQLKNSTMKCRLLQQEFVQNTKTNRHRFPNNSVTVTNLQNVDMMFTICASIRAGCSLMYTSTTR